MNPTAAYIRAIRGPVLLMTLGVLMLLDHLTAMSFWRLWPALLIVLGILFLAERAVATTTTTAAATYPGMAGAPGPMGFSSSSSSPYGGAYSAPGAPRSSSEGTTDSTSGGGVA